MFMKIKGGKCFDLSKPNCPEVPAEDVDQFATKQKADLENKLWDAVKATDEYQGNT